MITKTPGLLSLAAAILFAETAAAQTIRGRVLDDATNTPISAVTVTVMDPDGAVIASTETNQIGDFLLRVNRAGNIRLHVRHIAYEPLLSDLLQLGNKETVQFEIRLAQNVIPLDPIVVVSRSTLGVSGFYARLSERASSANFVTREQIDRYKGSQTTGLLRNVPGLRVVPAPSPSGSMTQYHIEMPGTGGAGGCSPTVYVDGMYVENLAGGGIDELLSPHQLEGVEVYSQFAAPQSLPPRSHCGVIAFWTRPEEGGDKFSWGKLFGGLAAVIAVTLLLP